MIHTFAGGRLRKTDRESVLKLQTILGKPPSTASKPPSNLANGLIGGKISKCRLCIGAMENIFKHYSSQWHQSYWNKYDTIPEQRECKKNW